MYIILNLLLDVSTFVYVKIVIMYLPNAYIQVLTIHTIATLCLTFTTHVSPGIPTLIGC